MTDLSSIPTWPPIQAVTRPDGTGELTINGTSYQIQTDSPHAARQEIVRRVVDTAAKLKRPVHVATTGPDGNWPIIVYPDGKIEPDTTRAAPPPADPRDRGRQPLAQQPVTRPLGQPAAPPQYASPPASPATPQRVSTGEVPPQRAAEHLNGYNATPAIHHHTGSQPAAPAPSSSAAGPWVQDPPPAQSPAPPAEPAAEYVPRRSFLTQEQAEEPASQGWRGVMTRIGIRMAPSAIERNERADVRAVSQHWPGPRTIAVVNGKGGVGKTPSTILLSAVFARYGGAGVLAWDNNQTRGTLGWRTEQGPHEATLLDLLPQTERLLGTNAQSADLAHFVHHQTRDRFDVLRSKPMVLADEQRVEPGDVDAIWSVAAKYYRLILMDSGNDEADPMWLRMIDHTDQLVVVTTTRDDHAEAGALLLEALGQRDERSARLAEQAVAIVTQADPKATAQEVRDIAQGYRSLAREAVTIPHDPAMVDGVLRYGSLRPATQRAWLAAGAAVARGL